MAMGGTFLTHNKVLPGAYINFISKARPLGTIGDRGVVAICLEHNFGTPNEVIRLDSETLQKDSLKVLGYAFQDDKLQPFREMIRNAKEILFYRLGGDGTKATSTIEPLTITAKYGGTRYNDIKIVIENNVDDDKKIVKTYIDTNILVDEQMATNIEELKPNDFVVFSGTGALVENGGTNLTSGTDGTVNGSSYSNFLDKIENYSFDIIGYSGEDEATKALYESFTKRLRYDEGVKATCLLINYNKADDEGVISLDETAKDLFYWTLGALGGCKINESLTNRLYDGEIPLNIQLKKSELEEKIKTGIFAFYGEKDEIRVLKDINTFTNYKPDKNQDFSNNQIIRILDNIGNDIARIFNSYYLGKEINDNTGRNLFKAELISYFKNLQAIRTLDNFNSDNLTVLKGTEKGDVVVDVLIEPVASMDKLYMKCIIE